MPQDLPELLLSASRGDARSLDELLERYLPGLRAFVRLKAGAELREREEADDLVQSVCREVLQQRPGFEYRGEGPFRHWLYTAALRKIADRAQYYRAIKRDARREQPLMASEAADAHSQQALRAWAGFYTPSQQAAAREELERIERALGELPEDYREALVLSRIVGLSRAEIAEHMGRSETAVKGLLARALVELSGRLGPAGGA